MIRVEIQARVRLHRGLLRRLCSVCRNCRSINLIVIRKSRILAFKDRQTRANFYFDYPISRRFRGFESDLDEALQMMAVEIWNEGM